MSPVLKRLEVILKAPREDLSSQARLGDVNRDGEGLKDEPFGRDDCQTTTRTPTAIAAPTSATRAWMNSFSRSLQRLRCRFERITARWSWRCSLWTATRWA